MVLGNPEFFNNRKKKPVVSAWLHHFTSKIMLFFLDAEIHDKFLVHIQQLSQPENK